MKHSPAFIRQGMMLLAHGPGTPPQHTNPPLSGHRQPGVWPGREGKRRCRVGPASWNSSRGMLQGLSLLFHPGGLSLGASSGILTFPQTALSNGEAQRRGWARTQKSAIMKNELHFHPHQLNLNDFFFFPMRRAEEAQQKNLGNHKTSPNPQELASIKLG